MFQKRTKSAWGNVGMAILCLPLGYFVGDMAEPGIPLWGFISGLVASIVERYEFGPVDDNIIIVICSSIVLLVGLNFGPL